MTDIKITKKQLEILKLLYKFRFLNRVHIQTLLKHKGPRRIKAWCKDLTNKKCTGRHYSKKLKENTKPAIYYLGTKSINILDNGVNKQILKRIYKESNLSKKMVNHCLTLADIYLQLMAKFKHVDFFTKTDLLAFEYLPENRPDAYVAIKNKTTKRYFLEIIDPKTPRFVMRSVVKKNIDYFQDNIWQNTAKLPFPKILLICLDQKSKNYLKKYIVQILEEEVENNIHFYISGKNIFKWVNPAITQRQQQGFF